MNIVEYAKMRKMFGGGSGGGSSAPNDGKTRLYITIGAEGRMDVPLYLKQNVAHGVVVDWGDGSATETSPSKSSCILTHTYANIGDYVISLEVAEGCELGFGNGGSSYCVMGYTEAAYCAMLKRVEIGNNVPTISQYAFQYCAGLSSLVISDSVTTISGDAFCWCSSLPSVIIPNSVTAIGAGAFGYCRGLANIVIPNSVTTITARAFTSARGVKFFDFTSHTAVPTLANTSAFSGIVSDCEIRVPASLVDEWKAATNWATYASNIVGV